MILSAVLLPIPFRRSSDFASLSSMAFAICGIGRTRAFAAVGGPMASTVINFSKNSFSGSTVESDQDRFGLPLGLVIMNVKLYRLPVLAGPS